MKRIRCHCGADVRRTTGREIYPHRPDLYAKPFWRCMECRSYVGCHPGTRRPLGIPADQELRGLRIEVHALLDPLWREGAMTRRKAYLWLGEQLGIPEVHVGFMDKHVARRAIQILRARSAEPRKA